MPVPALPAPMTAAQCPAPRPGALGTRSVRGVEFSVLPGFRPLLLDLVLPPEGTAPAPVVVFVHGGGWFTGSRRSPGPAFASWSPSLSERVAAAGIAVASVDYRLSGEAVWPAQLDDVAAALRWLRTEGPALGLDPGRTALWGESAGGHLAALAGLLGDDPHRGGGTVRAVLDWYGPSDLAGMAEHTAGRPPAPDGDPALPTREDRLLGVRVTDDPARAADASPVTHVHPAAPAFLLLHGREDRVVPPAQSVLLAERLRAAGAPVDLGLVDGADHVWDGLDAAALEAVVERSLGFLRQHLLG